MKHVSSLISMLLFVTTLFTSSVFAKDYVHYKTLTGHNGGVRSVAFSPDGKTIAGSSDKTVRFWDAATGNHKNTLIGHTDDVTSLSFSPDGQTLASGSLDYTICLWDVATGKNLRTFTGHTSGVWSVSFSPDG